MVTLKQRYRQRRRIRCRVRRVEASNYHDVSCGCEVARVEALNWRAAELRPPRGCPQNQAPYQPQSPRRKIKLKRSCGRHREGDISPITPESSIQKMFCLTLLKCHNCEFRWLERNVLVHNSSALTRAFCFIEDFREESDGAADGNSRPVLLEGKHRKTSCGNAAVLAANGSVEVA
jgi:hypothetical protein